ncbi:MAG: choice-of-anchor D domain-containing protein, partial [Terracidiphilus sp.]
EPYGVAVEGAGDLYIADTVNNRVVEVTAAGAASVLNVGSPGSAPLNNPTGVAVDGAGDVYIADQQNFRVVKINQATQALSFTSTGTGDSSAQQTMTVENIGNQPLNITALNTTTTGLTTSIFDLNGPTTCTDSTSLIAGATCDLGVEFAPTAPGSFNGTADITDNNLNAAGAVQQVQLSGTGTGFAATMALSEAPSSSVTYGTPVTVTATLS